MVKQSRQEKRTIQRSILKETKKQQKKIREERREVYDPINHRTQASNAKFTGESIAEERAFRAEISSAQIKAWNAMLPSLLKKFAKIKDPRQPGKIKYRIAVLMLYGLLTSIFRLTSKREANAKMSRPQFIDAIRRIFPQLSEIPHADTLSTVLEKTDPEELDVICASLISDLIRNKKFSSFLINNKIPISIDGVQKLSRNHFTNENYHDRKVSTDAGQIEQQYIFVVEANITLYNGLTIPITSEFLIYDLALPDDAKQDCEINACKRILTKIKSLFKRAGFIVFLDGLYPNRELISMIIKNGWDYMIVLKKNKCPIANNALNLERGNSKEIIGQDNHRERKQDFYFIYDQPLFKNNTMVINAVACHESWKEVVRETGKIITRHAEHRWITNVIINIKNAHELCNLGARRRWLIEDSNNTEKNRGYGYKHLKSHCWNAIRCYHYLLRLGHAINAISEFTRVLKKYIKEYGLKVVLDLIVETLANPWLSEKWFEEQLKISPRLLF